MVIGLWAAPASAQVRTSADLLSAVAAAKPGDVITLAAGTYSLGAPLALSRPGPVLLRGSGKPDQVILQGTGQGPVVRVSGVSWHLQRMTVSGSGGLRVDSTGI